MPDSLKDAIRANTAQRRALFQGGYDLIVSLRGQLAAALLAFNEAADAEKGDDDELDAWIAANRDPHTPTPPPIAPEVAAPPPAIEPPVFTTVDTAALTPDTTTPGYAPTIDPTLLAPESSVDEGGDESGGADADTNT